MIVISVVIRLIVRRRMTNSGSALGTVLASRRAIASAITSLISQVLAAGLYKGATLGRRWTEPSRSEASSRAGTRRRSSLAAIIIGFLTLIGTFLCYLPGLLVGFFTQFTLLFIVDKHMRRSDAIQASFRLCIDNLGPTILLLPCWPSCVVVVGACLCLVGLLVAIPVVLVGLAYTYRRLQNEPVVA